MANYDALVRNTQVDVDAITWTALEPSINGRTFVVRNTATDVLNLRIVSTDPTTEVSINPLSEQPAMLNGGSYTFQIGSPVYYAQLDSGTGTILIMESL